LRRKARAIVVVGTVGDDELEFVGGTESEEIGEEHLIVHAGGGALDVDDADYAGGDGGDVEGAVGFEEDFGG